MPQWPRYPERVERIRDTREWLDFLGRESPPSSESRATFRELDKDAKWENCLVVYDGNGNILETWKQWDKIFRRPHSVYVSPYDPEKNVWIVDDNMDTIYRFTHDGSKLLQTIGTPEIPGEDRQSLQSSDVYRLAP